MSTEHINHFEYNETENLLTITFNGGTVNDFHPVNPETYAELIRADILARAIHKLIRNGKTVGVYKGN